MSDAPSPPNSTPTLGNPIVVAAAVVRRGEKLLLARRPPHKRHGGLWEFPGGKLHDGESLAEAVHRELREELGLEVQHVGPILFDAPDPGSPYLIRFVEAAVPEGAEPAPTEHDAVEWLTPAQAHTLRLAPSDARFVHHLLATPPPTPG